MSQDKLLFDVFISHKWNAAHDRYVEALANALTDDNGLRLRVFFDKNELKDADLITKRIKASLDKSRSLLVWQSKDYLKSPGCQQELFHILALAKNDDELSSRLIIVQPSDQPRADIAVLLDLKTLSFDSSHAEESIATLAEVIRTLIADKVPASPVSQLHHYPDTEWYPYKRFGSKHIINRVDLLLKIYGKLFQRRYSQTNQTHKGIDGVAIVGVTGTGKTALAYDFARSFAAAFPGGIFLLDRPQNLGAPESIKESLVEQILNVAIAKFDINIDKELTHSTVLAVLRRYLNQIADDLLIIIDGWPQNGDIKLIQWLLGAFPTRRTFLMVTGAAFIAESFSGVVEVPSFSEAQAVTLLFKHRPASSQSEEDAAHTLARVVAMHPLAIDVLGSAVEFDTHSAPFAKWQQLISAHPWEGFNSAALRAASLPDEASRAIAATFSNVFLSLSEDERAILRVASNLAITPITGMMAQIIVFGVSNAGFFRPVSFDLNSGSDSTSMALQGLQHRSLITSPDGDKNTWLVHGLTALLFRTIDFGRPNDCLLDNATHVVTQIIEATPLGLHIAPAEIGVPHAFALVLSHQSDAGMHLLDKLGEFFLKSGRLASSNDCYRLALSLGSIIGELMPLVNYLDRYGQSCITCGLYQPAASAFKRAIAILVENTSVEGVLARLVHIRRHLSYCLSASASASERTLALSIAHEAYRGDSNPTTLQFHAILYLRALIANGKIDRAFSVATNFDNKVRMVPRDNWSAFFRIRAMLLLAAKGIPEAISVVMLKLKDDLSHIEPVRATEISERINAIKAEIEKSMNINQCNDDYFGKLIEDFKLQLSSRLP